tara:strand:+ start:30 stop:314 length:285 start_codon:yes stop_codon:yes gene_type:complete
MFPKFSNKLFTQIAEILGCDESAMEIESYSTFHTDVAWRYQTHRTIVRWKEKDGFGVLELHDRGNVDDLFLHLRNHMEKLKEKRNDKEIGGQND